MVRMSMANAQELVRELNRSAQELLLAIHRDHLQAQGGICIRYPQRDGGSHPDLNLDRLQFRAAAQRLVSKGLAKGHGIGGVAVLPAGVEAAENAELLEHHLPTRHPDAASLPGDVIASIRETRTISLDFVDDADLKGILERDLDELEHAARDGLHKCVAMLGGSIAEALLVDVLDRRRDIAQGYMAKHKKFPADASIDQLVAIAKDEKLLDAACEALVAPLRDYRDAIHPDKERRVRAKIDDASTSALMALLRLVCRSLRDANSDGRVAAYIAK